MSAFNIVTGRASCPNCERTSEFEVQFKYGDTWQHPYRIGDELLWGGNDVGRPGRKRVLAKGIGGPCPYCHVEYPDFDVVIDSDRVVAIEPFQGPRPPSSSPERFIILEP